MRAFRLLIPILIALALFITAFPVAAQDSSLIETSLVSHSFGEWISFNITLNPGLSYQYIDLVITPRHTNNSTVQRLIPDQNNLVTFIYETAVHGHIRAFNYIDYQIVATLANGEQRQSLSIGYEYEDNRRSWNTIATPPFKVSYYQGDTAFAQRILDTALASIGHTDQFLHLNPPQDIRIIVYPSSGELRQALSLTNQSWVAGHADPDLGIALVSILPGPEDILEIERQIPHEITHLRLFQQLSTGYNLLPAWLNEGIASLSEFYPNPGYQNVLRSAYETGTLFPISQLCQSIPPQAADAVLAYAQAESFTRYLYNQYSAYGLTSIVEAYAQGHPCETGTQVAIGETLSQLERSWLEHTFSENPTAVTLSSISGWFGLMLFALIGPALLIILSLKKK